MNIKEVRKIKEDKLPERLEELKKDLFMLRVQHATNKLENPIRLREVRRDIARVKTEIRRAELAKITKGEDA
ncbi:MAG: 50S ribosomal protein L29 [Oscillospiraceae bacterium]|jgi:large subunit ribosomal protein L29|nr:50S ribosomal protein L29 [Oscillospiraceae bacterium]